MLQILHAHLFQCILQYNVNKSGIQTKLPPPRGTCIFFGSLKFQKKTSVGQTYGWICLKFCMYIHFSAYYMIMYTDWEPGQNYPPPGPRGTSNFWTQNKKKRKSFLLWILSHTYFLFQYSTHLFSLPIEHTLIQYPHP